MRLYSGAHSNPNAQQRRIGMLAPMLDSVAKVSSRGTISQQALEEFCYVDLRLPAEEWRRAVSQDSRENQWNLTTASSLLRWARNLGLLEAEGALVSELGEVWRQVWRASSVNPLVLISSSRRMLAWTTLLASDGFWILRCWAGASSDPMSIRELSKKIGTPSLPRRWANVDLSEMADLRRRFLQPTNDTAIRRLLAPRIEPLRDLGVIQASTYGQYQLTEFGHALREEITSWLSDEDLIGGLHLKRAWRLASGVRSKLESNNRDLKDQIIALLRETVLPWRARPQWPLLETLLLTICQSCERDGRGFELANGVQALEAIHKDTPGIIEWVPGRHMDQRYFRLRAIVDPQEKPDDGDLPASVDTSRRGEGLVSAAECASQSSLSTADDMDVAARREKDSALCGEPPVGAAPEAIQTIGPTVGIADVAGPAATVSGIEDAVIRDTALPGLNHQTVPTCLPDESEPIPSLPADSLAAWRWICDALEDQLLFEECRPVGLPLFGAESSLDHLLLRLTDLGQLTTEKQSEFFWSRFKPSGELAAEHKNQLGLKEVAEGQYGQLLLGLESAWDSLQPHHLVRRLGSADTKDNERLTKAKARLRNAIAAIRSQRYELLSQFPLSTSETVTRFSHVVRDALLSGRIELVDIANLLASKDILSELPEFLSEGRLFPSRSSSPRYEMYQVTLQGRFAEPLVAELKKDGVFQEQRNAKNAFELESLEVRPSTLDEGVQSSRMSFTAGAEVRAVSVQHAVQEAETWLLNFITQLSLGLVSFEDAECEPLFIEAIDASLRDQPSNKAPARRIGSIMAHLRPWRPSLSRPRLSLVRSTVLSSDHPLRRSLELWRRAFEAVEPVPRFTYLWSGLEHLLRRAPGMHFIPLLSRVLVLPMLRQRLRSLAHEIALRLLRIVMSMRMPQEFDEAQQIYRIITSFCMNPSQAQAFEEKLPLASIGSWLSNDIHRRNSRHNCETAPARDFVHKILASTPEEHAKVICILKKYTPGLAVCFEKWQNALLNRQELLRCVVEEHDSLLVQYSLCYDLRNRIQHDGDHFPGRESWLNQASEYLRAWLGMLISLLLRHADKTLDCALWELQLPLDDFRDSIGQPGQPNALRAKPTPHELSHIFPFDG